jgi:hypothetical protein
VGLPVLLLGVAARSPVLRDLRAQPGELHSVPAPAADGAVVIRIDQARINEWIEANPLEVTRHNAEATAAVYPRPLAFWRGWAPQWVTVTEEPGGIIALAPVPTGKGQAADRRSEEALERWLRGCRPVAGAIIEET